VSHHKYALWWPGKLHFVKLEYVSKRFNKMVNTLANLAATLALGAKENTNVPICTWWVVASLDEEIEGDVNLINAQEVAEQHYCQPLINHLQHGKLPNDPRHKTEIQRRAPYFLYFNETLYRCSFLGLWLQCLDNKEARQLMEKEHSGICGAHQVAPKLYDHIKRTCYN